MKYVSTLITTIMFLAAGNAMAERNSGEYLMQLGNAWANQPQSEYILRYHQPQQNQMVRQGQQDGLTNAIRNLQQQDTSDNNKGGSYGNTYNFYGSDNE